MRAEALRRYVYICIALALTAAGIYIAVKYLLGALLPLIIAYITASALQKPILFICRRTGKPWLRKLVAAVLVCVVLSLVFWLALTVVSRLAGELGELLAGIKGDAASGFYSSLCNAIEDILMKIPFPNGENGELANEISAFLHACFDGIVAKLASRLPTYLTSLLSALPEGFLFIAVTLLCAVYIAADYPSIRGFLRSVLPEKLRGVVRSAKTHAVRAAVGSVRAAVISSAAIFALLCAVFMLLKLKYAALIALLIALVDILPVLGAGAVLIPWAIIGAFSGKWALFAALAASYALSVLIHEILQSRLIGESVGLHPVVALASVYVGLRLAGIAGMLLFPVAAIFLCGYFKEKAEAKEKFQ